MINVDREAIRRRQAAQQQVDQARLEQLRAELLRWRGPIPWYTLDEAAALCKRHPSTLRNLISRYDLPRRLLWNVFRRQRRRQVMLAPPVVRWLQERTLGAPTSRERRAGEAARMIERGRPIEGART
jgi:hypothetical protein